MRVFLMRIRLPRTERSIFIRIDHELYCLEIMNYIIYQLRDLENYCAIFYAKFAASLKKYKQLLSFIYKKNWVNWIDILIYSWYCLIKFESL